MAGPESPMLGIDPAAGDVDFGSLIRSPGFSSSKLSIQQ